MQNRWAFSSGTQYADWLEKECGSCRFYNPDAAVGAGCSIEGQVLIAYIVGNEVAVPSELVETGEYHPYRCKKRNPKGGHLA